MAESVVAYSRCEHDSAELHPAWAWNGADHARHQPHPLSSFGTAGTADVGDLRPLERGIGQHNDTSTLLSHLIAVSARLGR